MAIVSIYFLLNFFLYFFSPITIFFFTLEDIMLTNSTIIKYLENKGYYKTAKAYRTSSNFGNGEAKPSVTVTKMHNYYYDLDENEDECTVNPEADTESIQSLKRKTPEPEPTAKVVDSSECERCFLGNMSFKINEEALKKAFADCGSIVSVEWVTDKQTGQFYGSGFAVFDTVEAARKAVAVSGRPVLGRPIKVNFAPLKKSDNVEKKKMPPPPSLSAKPAHCTTLFLGNLSFEVTEEAIREFFDHCGGIYVRLFFILFFL